MFVTNLNMLLVNEGHKEKINKINSVYLMSCSLRGYLYKLEWTTNQDQRSNSEWFDFIERPCKTFVTLYNISREL